MTCGKTAFADYLIGSAKVAQVNYRLVRRNKTRFIMPWFVQLIAGLANSGNNHKNSSEMTFLNSILNKSVSEEVKNEAASYVGEMKDNLTNVY